MTRIDCLRIGGSALRWLSANLRHFGLPAIDDPEESTTIGKRRKAFGELAIATMVAQRSPRLRRSPEYARVLEHLTSAARQPDFSFDMLRRPGLFPFYAGVFGALKACGQELPAVQKRIARMLEFGFLDAVERTPRAKIDLKYLLDLGGFSHLLPAYADLYRGSIAQHLPPVVYLRRDDIYDLTHIIFHVADFGRDSLGAVLADRLEATRDYVSLLLATRVVERDWDLVGELLLCCRCLSDGARPPVAGAWRALESAQAVSGYVSGPESKAGGEFAKHYHPTLVALLASAAEDGAA